MIFKKLKQILGKGRDDGALGLEVRPDGLAWGYSNALGTLVSSGFIECKPAGRQQALDSLVSEQALSGIAVTTVLAVEHYQTFQVDRPAVDESEIVAAVRWKLKDLLDYKVEEAVFDVFPFPEDAARGRGELINVVCARKSMVVEQARLAERAGLALVRVDIAELALRNLAAALDPEGRGVALLYLRQNQGQMILAKGPVLYLSRRIDLPSGGLNDASQQEVVIQGLALEIQRSMDYYESQMGQFPPRTINVLAQLDGLPLLEMLGSNIAADVVACDRGALALAGVDHRSVLASAAVMASGGTL